MRRFPLTLLALVAITWASLTSHFPEMPRIEEVPFYDKWAHFLMYGTLTLVVQWECHRLARRGAALSAMAWTLLCALMPFVWGVLMELGQAYLTTWRTGDPVDAIANTVGVVLGLISGRLIFFRTKGQS